MDGKCFHVVWMVWTVWRVWMIWIVWIVWNNMDLLMEMNTDRWVIYLIWILNNITTHPVLPDLGLWNDGQVGTQFWKCEGFDTSQQVDWFFHMFRTPPVKIPVWCPRDFKRISRFSRKLYPHKFMDSTLHGIYLDGSSLTSWLDLCPERSGRNNTCSHDWFQNLSFFFWKKTSKY